MPVIICHCCASPLTRDDRLHYLIECHACAVREHDLWHAVRRDPDHPDAARLGHGPVELGPARSLSPARRGEPVGALPPRRRIAPARARG